MKDTRSIWVMSKVHDSVWITGSVMICYLFLAIYYGLNNLLGFTIVTSSLVIYFLWTVIFDGTHAFATYSRTYFDKDFRTKNIDLLVGSLVLFIAGPLYMLFFYCIATEEQYRAAFLVFNRFGILYAYYHLIRQHWGFVSIYNRKAKITSKTQVFLDSILLWSGTVYAFFYHNTYHYVPFGLAEKLADGISRSDWLLLVKMLLAIFCFNVILKLYVSYKAIKNFEKIFFNLAWIFLLAACSVIVFLFFGLHDSMLIITYTTRLIFLTTIVSYIMYTIFSEIQIKYCYPKFILLFAVLFTHNFILSLPLSYLHMHALPFFITYNITLLYASII
ncbi:hypothetical protein [Candidatus Tisiphia endosymbiont of Metellina segmentata]|uniref:hypothetical protein n=1 Tax=Candidatus Tisiphia endosymbiont of Metellina segmentata TaxID=3066274 RepID=UPI00313B852C